MRRVEVDDAGDNVGDYRKGGGDREGAVGGGGGQHGVQDRYHDEGEWEGHGGEHQRLPGGFEAVLAASEDGRDGSEEPRAQVEGDHADDGDGLH